MATQSIKVPVELQLKNLGSAIDTLKKALKGVSDNSGIGQELAKEIKNLEKRYASLAQEAKRSFTSAGEVQTFGNHFRKLSESIEITAERFKEIKFKDLKLPEDVQKQFDVLQQKITDAKTELEDLVNTSFKKNSTEAGNDLAVSLENFKKAFSDLKFNTSSFDATYTTVKDKLIDLQREKDKLDRKMTTASNEYEGAKKQFDYYNTIKEQLTKVKNKTQLENFAAMYEGQAKKLNVSTDDYLKNILGIDMQALRAAADKGEQELNQIITNLLNSTSKGTFGKMFTDRLNTVNSKLQIFEGLQGDTAKINGLISTVKELDAALESFSQGGDLKTKTEELQGNLQAAQQAMKEFVTETMNSSTALNQSGNAAQQAAASLQPLQNKIEATKNKIQQLNEHAQKMNHIKQTIGMWFGLTRAFQSVKKTVNAAVKEIRELDKVMTEIAVVTDMNQKQLWGQINTYSNIAKQYGVSTLGAYQVSQLWYQQGLQTNEVMELTTETLKMAKIANLDYSTATDYMTVAIRGFKLEMSEAATVTDVYSALAAGTASDTKELAIAMSKTASSAEAVGSSFESTSAMIATMISVTREAPENIGSAMKSIISRYGEMTSDPTKLVDGEGEAMSLNKVDKALQSVGISLQDVKGEFRDFDDVILELAKSWDTIDTNTQRYIATVMAGNRQQSRFLALVGNYEEYSRALEIANNSEDAGTLQALKTMDSLETKIQGVKTAWQQFYNSMGLEEAFKSGLEVITQIINNLNRLNKPAAFATIYTLFTNLGSIVKNLFNMISNLIKSVGITTKAELDKLEEERKIKLSNSEANKEVEETQQKVNDLEKSKTLTVKTNEAQEKINKLKQTIADLTASDIIPTGEGKNLRVGGIKNSVSLFGRGSHNPLQKAMNQFSHDSGLKYNDPDFFSKFADSIQNNTELLKQLGITTDQLSGKKQQEGQASQTAANADNSSANSSKTLRERFNELGASVKQVTKKALDNGFGFGTEKGRAAWSQVANGLITAGTMLTAAALTMKDSYTDTKEKSKMTAGWGNLASAVGGGISGGISGIAGGPVGIIIGAIAGALPGLIGAFKSFSDGINFTIQEKLTLLEDEINESKNTATKSKGEAISLKNNLDELKQLEEAQYDSAEAAQAYKDKMAQIGETYPELIAWTEAAGEATIDATLAEQALAEARVQAAQDALDLAEQEFTQKELERQQAQLAQGKLNKTFENIMTGYMPGQVVTGISFHEGYEFGIDDIYYPELLEGLSDYNKETGDLTKEGWDTFKSALTRFFTEGASSLTEAERTLLQGVTGLFHDPVYAQTFIENYATLETTKVEDLQQIPIEILHAEPMIIQTLENGMIEAFTAIGKTQEDLFEFLDIKDWSELTSDEFLAEENLLEAYESVVGYVDNLIQQRTEYLSSYGQVLAKSQFDKNLSELAQSNVIDNPELYDIISEYSSMFSTLMTGMLTTKKRNMDWSDYFDSDRYKADVTEINEIFGSFISQFDGNAQALEDFIQIYNNPNHFKSADELRGALSELGINIEDFEEVEAAMVSRYNNSIAAARKRVNDAIANSGDQVKGAFHQGDSATESGGFDWLFSGRGVTELSTQYADHVVDSINQINDLAEKGMIASAELLADIVLGVYTEIGQLDSETQTEVFDIIKQVDWTDASSLTSAIEGMESYIEFLSSKGYDTGELEDVLEQLQEAKDNLIFNIQTEFQNYRDAIVKSVEGTTKTISNLTQGMDLTEAFEAFESIISMEGNETLSFDSLFEYNEALGKWVYTQAGFIEAIETEQTKLEEAQEQAAGELEEFNAVWRDNTARLIGQILRINRDNNNVDIYDGIESEELSSIMSSLKDTFGETFNDNQWSLIERTIQEYNPDIHGSSFYLYIKELISTYAETAEQAEQMYTAFIANKSQLFLAGLDFETLASGQGADNQRTILIEALKTAENFSGDANAVADEIIETAISNPLRALELMRTHLGENAYSYDEAITLITTGSENFQSAMDKYFAGNALALSKAEGKLLVELGLAEWNGAYYELIEAAVDLSAARAQVLANTTMTLEQQTALLRTINSENSGIDKIKAQTDFGGKSELNLEDLDQIGLDILGWSTDGLYGSLSDYFLNSEEVDLSFYGLDLNEETGNFDVVNFAAYWTNLLERGAASGEEYELAYQKYLTNRAEKAQEYNELIETQINNLATLPDLNSGETINVSALEAEMNEVGASLEDYGFEFDETTGEISLGADGIADYIGLYHFLYEKNLFMRNASAEKFEQWLAGENEAMLTNSSATMEAGYQAVLDIIASHGTEGASPVSATSLRNALGEENWKAFITTFYGIAEGSEEFNEYLNAESIDLDEAGKTGTEFVQALAEVAGSGENFLAIFGVYLSTIQQIATERSEELDIATRFLQSSAWQTLSSGERGSFNLNDLMVNGSLNSEFVDQLNLMADAGMFEGLDETYDFTGYQGETLTLTEGVLLDDTYLNYLTAIANIFGLAEEETEQVFEDLTTKRISELNAEVNKFSNAFESIFQAKAGESIDITNLESSLQDVLREMGAVINGDIATFEGNINYGPLLSYIEGLEGEALDTFVETYGKTYSEIIVEVEELINQQLERENLNQDTALSQFNKILSGEVGNFAVESLELFLGSEAELLTSLGSGLIPGLTLEEVNGITTIKIDETFDPNAVFESHIQPIMEALGYTDTEILEASAEAARAVIEKATKNTTAANSELEKILELEAGMQQEITYLTAVFGAEIGEILQLFGYTVEEEIITAGENADPRGLLNELQIQGKLEQLGRDYLSYLEQFSNLVDEEISRQTSVGEGASSSLSNIREAKVGDKINVVYLVEALTRAGQNANAILENYGIQVDRGLATIGENANIYGLMQEIAALESSGALEISDSLGELKDVIQEMFDSWISALSAGLAGNLSNTDAETLKQQFAFLTDADFTETKNGLRISKEAAYELYRHLQGINAIQAELAFDALVENAMNSDESLNNVYKVMQKIADLNEDIANAEIGSDRRKALETELKITEGIKDNLIAAGDAFNFMNQDLPTGMTNPLSAWEGMGDAFNILGGDDFAANRIGFQDFYNMITMMGDEVLAAAGIFTNDSQTAADLIEASAAALTNIDGETFVDLSKLGTNFNLGAEGMKEGLTDGIHTLAKNQIEMLDAAIGVLETVVAMEKIGDIVGEDGVLSFGDLFEIKEDGTRGIDSLTTLLTENEEFAKVAEQIIIDGESLAYYLQNGGAKLEQLGEEGSQNVLQALNALYSLSQRDDFDPSNLQSIFDIFTQVGFNGYIELKDQEGKVTGYWYNGKEYTTPEEANAAIALAMSGGTLINDFETLTDESGQTIGFKTTSAISGIEYEFTVGTDGAISYTIDGLEGEYSSLEAAMRAYYATNVNPEATEDSAEANQYLIDIGLNAAPRLIIDPTKVAAADEEARQRIQEIINGDSITGQDVTTFATFGIQFTEGQSLNAEQIAQLKSVFGIEDKTINLTVNATNVDAEIYNLLNGTTTDIPTTIALTVENGENVQTTLSAIKDTLIELESRGYNIELAYNITTTSDNDGTYNVTLNDQGTVETLTNLAQALTNLNTQANALKDSANAIEATGPDNVKALKEQINNLPDKSTEVGNTADAMSRLSSKTISAKIVVSVSAPDGSNTVARTRSIQMTTQAKGNVALSKGTLMGELGPELYVTNGHYYVAGQNGAEFVDLPDDAIVFNHLQTQRLLSSGSSGRGEPVTNEKKAVAFAGGNVSGPAMASAESALAELKAIRAMWTALLNQDAKSLGKKAGSGGGGGGGGGSPEETAAYIHSLERWYNLLRQIEKLEEQINYEQAKRENMRNGYDYSKSLQKELSLLKEQRKVYEDLSRLQKDYYDKRRQDLLSTDYSKIFTYDEDGLMQYVDGKDRGLDILATLNATDAYGKAKMNASQQLAYLRSVGFNTSVLNTNADGTKAESDEQRVQNFWDGVDSWMAELDDLYDSYNEAATNMEEATQAINEILQEYIDNQLAVEEKLMQAIQDREQAEIDRIQDEKDALDEAAQEYINGLNEALNKERDMYQKNETDAETAKLQRQLAILQRSGGSTSEIKSLQDQIDSRLQDAYFQEQQDQIDAIQEASDNQLEKLQTQIDLMTETLEYQKEHGLLWQEVYEMMNNWTPEQMLQFIEQYTQEYQENSALQNQQNSEETRQQLQMWDDDRQNKERDKAWTEYYDALDYDEKIKEDNKVKAQAAYNAAYATDGAAAAEAAANKVFEEAKTNSEQQNSSNSAPAEPAPVEPPATLTGVLTGGNVNMRSSASTSAGVVKKIAQGTTVTLTGMSSSKKNGYYWFKASAGGKTGYMAYTSRWGNFSGDINTLPKFEKGGLVDFTGPAWVDGSKSKPEAFLSASDTEMLKSKIFSNSDGSLKALVAALEAITNDTSKYSAPEANASIIIQNAQVNIQPGTISNDYDARRAGEMALEEMVKIARKTTNRVVSR